MEKEIYQQPTAELIELRHPLTLLIDFSASGDLEDWEDGGRA
jgi:hypothetical protein